MTALRVLESRKRRRPCVRCKRVVTVGRRHKPPRARTSDPWCPASYEPGEQAAVALYVRAVHSLGRLCMSGQWGALDAAARGALRALGEKA